MYFPNSAAVSLLWCLNPNLCTLAGQYSLVLVCSHSCRTAALHVQWGGGNYQLGLLSNTCNNKRGRGRLAHRDSFSFYWNPILEFTAVSPGVGVFMWRQRGTGGMMLQVFIFLRYFFFFATSSFKLSSKPMFSWNSISFLSPLTKQLTRWLRRVTPAPTTVYHLLRSSDY